MLETARVIIAYLVIFGILLGTVIAIAQVIGNKKLLAISSVITLLIMASLYFSPDLKRWLEGQLPAGPTLPMHEINLVGEYLGVVKPLQNGTLIPSGSYKLTITKAPDKYRYQLESIYYDYSFQGELIKDDTVLYFKDFGEARIEELGRKLLINSIPVQQQKYEYEFSK